ncbi:Rft-1-domain-containing protein [Venturia nashicola]|uniref:Rft-1-domain-containing protein n=1 Tax=Venturia nashicola TaxID=86259 RepID=A0A4Z1PBI9_9PEZI|nr:Rft-1-domain-containing protein [Venturia nashicola]TLD35380.1 Rft-1-domain-containing protein [Venturia nashicola]
MSTQSSSSNLHGIVDMGSNGIRFSVTDMSPATARIMPTCYVDRAGISLYDAQWSTGVQAPIPPDVVADVVRAYKRFKNTCTDLGVPDENVRIIGTEATRQALNSEDFRAQIHNATGWTVEMLPKEEEGRVGAMGVVSSFSSVKGLMMDLGGGSTQITWLDAEHGQVRMSDAGSVSMPYGAAALNRRIQEANIAGGHAMDHFEKEVTHNLKEAVAKIEIPAEFTDRDKNPRGLNLHVSGGGFRGWGFVLMSQHPVQPYPCPIINGFEQPARNFENTSIVMATAANQENIFRVSERRASQVPAVATLVRCLCKALPAITTVKFAQGGVREGALFKDLPAEVKAEHPLVAATKSSAPPSSAQLVSLIQSATPLPNEHKHVSLPDEISPQLLTAVAQSLYCFNHLPKDLQAAVALRSTTSGVLAGTHGVSHKERAALAVILCEASGGEGSLAPSDAQFYNLLCELLEPSAAWWCKYYGQVAGVAAQVYPAGVVKDEKISFNTKWAEDETKQEKKHGHVLQVTVDLGKHDPSILQAEGLQKSIKGLAKMGKKKTWHKNEGGHHVDLVVNSGSGEALPESHFED